MNSYVIIFRKAPPAPTAELRQQIGREVAPWAQRWNDAGHRLVPHALAAESVHFGGDAAVDATLHPVTALLFLEARDLNEAARIAGSHPGLAYGFDVEVRAWSTPGAAPASVGTR